MSETIKNDKKKRITMANTAANEKQTGKLAALLKIGVVCWSVGSQVCFPFGHSVLRKSGVQNVQMD